MVMSGAVKPLMENRRRADRKMERNTRDQLRSTIVRVLLPLCLAGSRGIIARALGAHIAAAAVVEAAHNLVGACGRYGFQPFCQAGGISASMRMKAMRQGLPLLLTQA
jgi:hypothetical protein